MSRPERPLSAFAAEPEPEPVDPLQAAHDARETDEEEDADDDPNRCQGCGRHVTEAFRRVFGDNDDQVYNCPGCSDNSEFCKGAAADPDYEPRVKGGVRQ